MFAGILASLLVSGQLLEASSVGRFRTSGPRHPGGCGLGDHGTREPQARGSVYYIYIYMYVVSTIVLVVFSLAPRLGAPASAYDTNWWFDLV